MNEGLHEFASIPYALDNVLESWGHFYKNVFCVIEKTEKKNKEKPHAHGAPTVVMLWHFWSYI